ncbi:hypothetical protein FF2_024760 [Malus domestica]
MLIEMAAITTSIQETQTHHGINPSVTFWQRLATWARIGRESEECAVQGNVAAGEEDEEYGEMVLGEVQEDIAREEDEVVYKTGEEVGEAVIEDGVKELGVADPEYSRGRREWRSGEYDGGRVVGVENRGRGRGTG